MPWLLQWLEKLERLEWLEKLERLEIHIFSIHLLCLAGIWYYFLPIPVFRFMYVSFPPSPVQITLHEMIDYSQTVYSGSWGVTWRFHLHLCEEMLERWWLERLEKHSYFQENKCKLAGKPYQNR